jgi:hypothetical protein
VFHIIILPEVIGALRQLVTSKEDLLRVLERLRDELGNNAAAYRRIRDMDDPEFLFDYVHALHTGGRWLTLRFSVNDTTAEGYLFVEAVSGR